MSGVVRNKQQRNSGQVGAEQSITRRDVVFLLLGASLLFSGCGDGRPQSYPVSGQVVFPDGKTLQHGGFVIFQSTNLSPQVMATGPFGPDGKFQLTMRNGGDGLVAGNYNAAVTPEVPDNAGDLSPAEYLHAAHPISRRYMLPESSGFNFTVSAETAPHDFRLEVAKPRQKPR